MLRFGKHLLGLFNLLLLVSGVLSFVLYAVDRSGMVNVSKYA